MSRECKRGADSSAPLVGTPSPPARWGKYERVCGRGGAHPPCYNHSRPQRTSQDVVTSPGPSLREPVGRGDCVLERCHMVSDKQRRRSERVQVFLSSDEIAAIEEFRYEARMPSRQAAVRELLRRGFASDDDEERTH
jgi:hypothetical protein